MIPQELLDDLLEGEKAYQVFNINVRYSHDIGDRNVKDFGPRWFEGLPEGRLWDNASWYEMPKECPDPDTLIVEAREVWWPKFLSSREISNPADLTVTRDEGRWATWCAGWFSHWTWDIGLDDGQVLQSFMRHVDRIQELNRKEGKMVDGFLQEPYCLMGADDHWRWHGRTTGKKGDDDDERTPAPCRCPCCKERGVVSVDH